MADIEALYVELTKFYFDKGPDAQLNGRVGAWRALEASEFFVPGGGGLRFLLDFARSEECRGLINSDEVLARVVKQLDAAVEEISAVRDIARKYLPAADNEFADGEFFYNVRGEKVYASHDICANKDGM